MKILENSSQEEIYSNSLITCWKFQTLSKCKEIVDILLNGRKNNQPFAKK